MAQGVRQPMGQQPQAMDTAKRRLDFAGLGFQPASRIDAQPVPMAAPFQQMPQVQPPAPVQQTPQQLPVPVQPGVAQPMQGGPVIQPEQQQAPAAMRTIFSQYRQPAGRPPPTNKLARNLPANAL